MPGYDFIAVLPMLLMLAAFAGLIAIIAVIYSEVISRNCKVCGKSFIGNMDLKAHMRDHDELSGTKGGKGKKRFGKAA